MAELQRITAQRPALTPAARSPETTQRALLDRREADVLPLCRPIAARALQPKLTVGAADDPFEREAEHTADTVMAASVVDPKVTGSVSFGVGASGTC